MDNFATLVNRKLVVPSQKTSYLAIERDFLVSILEPRIAEIDVDEVWYLDHSPDVAEAIDRGEFSDAADHYCKVGFYEHRMPYPIEVDEVWYLKSYPDIAAAVRQGAISGARAHFYTDGYREGRFPHANFGLRAGGGQVPVLQSRPTKVAQRA